jgi:integrase/recombinase XerD
MKLSSVVTEYIAFKQALGMRFRTESRMLRAFCGTMGDVDISAVEQQFVRAYIDGPGPLTCYWHRKFEALTGFYRFAVARNYVAIVPLSFTIPKRPEPFVPYIYTIEQIRALVDGTNICSRRKTNLQPETFRMLLLLLFGTGLRLGEALRLKLSDFDIDNNLLTVCDTKFFKSRLVPTNPRLSKELSVYATKRRKWYLPNGEESVFFATPAGTSLSHTNVEKSFRKLCQSVGIRREDGARYQPRLHDARHTFVVTRLVSWYRQGADVQRLLPNLSTYIGHVHVGATQRYLTMTAELLLEASSRFEHYAMGAEVNHD